MKKITIQNVSTFYQDDYVLLNKASYLTKNQKENSWAYIKRKNNTKASVIIPLIFETQEIVLLKQFRIPVNQNVIEFPAGLIEKGENPALAGLRELEEETGYQGKVLSLSPLLSTGAGITSETIYLLLVEIIGLPKAQQLEESEEIEVLKIPLQKAHEVLKGLSKTCLIDAKVWTLLGWLSVFLKSPLNFSLEF